MPNINDFISSFKSTELSRPYNFEVIIPPPLGVLSAITKLSGLSFGALAIQASKNLKFRCEATELPARMFALVDQKTYGPIEQYPIQNAYNKSSMTFICSDTMEEKLFFDTWMDFISNSHPTGSITQLLPITGVKFDFEYKDNYVSQIMINQLGLKGDVQYRSVLSDAFPVQVNQLDLAWAKQNDYHHLNVTFAYRYSYYSPI